MLVILLIFALFRLLRGAPLTTTHIELSSDPAPISALDADANSRFGTRGVNDIIVSCIATIFACTWTAIHPNIPAPDDCDWDICRSQITTMIYALLAPEAITAWAMRQYFAARNIAAEYNRDIAMKESPNQSFFETLQQSIVKRFHKRRVPLLKKGEVLPWTITHGFFVQMGGFVLCEDGKLLQTLPYNSDILTSLVDHFRDGTIDISRIPTEAEIQDCSKGDILSKAIVVLQTTWFIVQCITRWSSSLPVTELEVVTLGFAMLNALTYGLWWNKPQSVRLPVYLERKKSEDLDKEASEATSIPIDAPPNIEQEALTPKKSFLQRKLQKDLNSGYQTLWKIPYRLIQAILRPLSRMLDFSMTVVLQGTLSVPKFYSAGTTEDAVVYIATSVIASLFGLIHLIPAWFLEFPSHSEMILWRISAAVITTQPMILGIWTKWSSGKIWDRNAKSSPLGIVALFGVPLYIIVRLTLIILAILSLRDLTPGALISIEWTSFIPHL